MRRASEHQVAVTQQAVLPASASATDIEYQRKLVELKISYAREVFGFAAGYDNAIVLAGYAAFFGLWAGVGDDVTSVCRTATAAMIGLSLTFYVLWHIAQMLHRQRFEFQQAKAFELEANPTAFLAEWDAIKERERRAWPKVLRFWRPMFVAAVGLGLLGGLTLIWNSVAVAFDIALQLTG